MKELKEYCGGEREIQIFRELTKKYEEHIGTNLDKVLELIVDKKIIGEISIVIKGVKKNNDFEFSKIELKQELNELIDAGLSLSAASKYLAKKKNLNKGMIYNLF